MKAKRILGIALSTVMAATAVLPWTGMTAFAKGSGSQPPSGSPTCYSFTLSATTGGSATAEIDRILENQIVTAEGGESKTVQYNDSFDEIFFTAEADSGYRFVEWQRYECRSGRETWYTITDEVTFSVAWSYLVNGEKYRAVFAEAESLSNSAVKTFVLDPELQYPADGSDQGYQNYYPSAETGDVTYATGLSGAVLSEEGWEALAGDDGRLTIGDQVTGSDLSEYVDVSNVGDEYKKVFHVTGSLVPYVIKVQNAQGTVYAYDDNGKKADIHVDCYVKDEDVEMKYHANFAGAQPSVLSDTAVTGSNYEVLDYTDLDLPAREGYVFKGWSTTPEGEVLYSADSVIDPVISGMDFYAVWEKEVEEPVMVSYTVKANYQVLDEEGNVLENYGNIAVKTGTGAVGSSVSVDPEDYVVYDGETYTYLSSTTGTSINLVDGSNEIILNYTRTEESEEPSPETVTIYYHPNYNGNDQVYSVDVNVDETFTVLDYDATGLARPAGSDVEFNGWTTIDLDKEYAAGDTINAEGDMHLYALWVTSLIPPVTDDEEDEENPPELPEFPKKDETDTGDNKDEVIDENETPLSPGTDEDTGAETEEAVLVASPDGGSVEGNDEEIGEEDVPLVDGAPQTGRTAAGSLALLAGAAAVAVITLKKRDEQ